MHAANKIPVIAILLSLTVTGAALTRPDNDKKYKNLKVLAKNIGSNDLERIMYTFERQLGVTCLYCHVTAKNVIPEKMDFASDEKKEKQVAREMLRMTIKINKKYFDLSLDKKIITKPVIWCRTCHMGYPIPHIQ